MANEVEGFGKLLGTQLFFMSAINESQRYIQSLDECSWAVKGLIKAMLYDPILEESSLYGLNTFYGAALFEARIQVSGCLLLCRALLTIDESLRQMLLYSYQSLNDFFDETNKSTQQYCLCCRYSKPKENIPQLDSINDQYLVFENRKLASPIDEELRIILFDLMQFYFWKLRQPFESDLLAQPRKRIKVELKNMLTTDLFDLKQGGSQNQQPIDGYGFLSMF
ncbi:hypothetical protein Ciccas_008065 [Cichlidogyrus casuarinus]|uniref:Uncharacterized protein n=1 Tax=Cichlidogyrus casuarinus TaxID=1844966 RepID=A0ABD2Q118_9PLAT